MRSVPIFDLSSVVFDRNDNRYIYGLIFNSNLKFCIEMIKKIDLWMEELSNCNANYEIVEGGEPNQAFAQAT